ncbi:hypothetical protein LDO31_09645 [Luteimonas sp. XNQY3]|nr:hypothetical protein [Luteimonas sp. XNQY3]MCD9006491.1 hypothetical protein [Luteimonas sp. XNQY3]
MTRSRWMITGAMFAIVVAGIAFRLLQSDDRPDSTVAAASIPEDAPRAATQRNAALLDAPFDSVRSELETAARGGDAAAAYRLGMAVARCMQYTPITSSRFDRMLSEAAAAGNGVIRIGARALGDDETIDLLLYAHGEQSRLCADTERLRADPPKENAFHWVAMAAERGYGPAMAAYGDVAFVEFTDDAALAGNASEVARRRERGKTLLYTAVAAGEPDAFMASARAHAVDGWLTPDPVLAYTHLLAYFETPDAARLPDSLRRDVQATYARDLSTDDRRQAEADAAMLLSRRGAGTEVTP